MPRWLALLALLAVTVQAVPPVTTVIDRLKNGSEQQQVDAMRRLASFASDPSFDAGKVMACLPMVVTNLKEGSDSAKEAAAGLVTNMASVPRNRDLLERYFAIKPLVEILRSGTDTSKAAKVRATAALQNLAASPRQRNAIAKVGGISALIAAVKYAPEEAHATLHNLAQHRDLKAIMLEKGYAPFGSTFDASLGDPNAARTIQQQLFFREVPYIRPPKARIIWQSTKHIVDENGRHTYQGGYGHTTPHSEEPPVRRPPNRPPRRRPPNVDYTKVFTLKGKQYDITDKVFENKD